MAGDPSWQCSRPRLLGGYPDPPSPLGFARRRNRGSDAHEGSHRDRKEWCKARRMGTRLDPSQGARVRPQRRPRAQRTRLPRPAGCARSARLRGGEGGEASVPRGRREGDARGGGAARSGRPLDPGPAHPGWAGAARTWAAGRRRTLRQRGRRGVRGSAGTPRPGGACGRRGGAWGRGAYLRARPGAACGGAAAAAGSLASALRSHGLSPPRPAPAAPRGGARGGAGG